MSTRCTTGACATLIVAAVLGGCSRRMDPLTVASTASTDRVILGEIVSQVIEKKLGQPVVRQFDIGGTGIAYEGLMLGTIGVYPDELNAFNVVVMKETVDPNPQVVYERVRSEMDRGSRILVLRPLGVSGRSVAIIRRSDQVDGGLKTLSEAAESKLAWTLGMTTEFQSRPDGFRELMTVYNLPLKVSPKVMTAPALYPALAENQLSMIIGHETDGPLAGEGFVVLQDDEEALRESPISLFIGHQAVVNYPQLSGVLDPLSGKFNNQTVRQLCFKVAVLKHNLKETVEEFLRKSGL